MTTHILFNIIKFKKIEVNNKSKYFNTINIRLIEVINKNNK